MLSVLIGILTFMLVIIELTIGFSILAIVNVTRIFIRSKSFKIKIAHLSNTIGNITVSGLEYIFKLMHGNKIQVLDDGYENKEKWYIAMSNHSSWADIFNILIASNNKIPLVKFFMKKELSWIPFIFLANKTLNMPFVHRHSRSEIEKDPQLRFKDYENTKKSCQRFKRAPSTIFSYAEGTRYTYEKKINQNSNFKNLLNPKSGGMATSLSILGNIEYLIDYTIIYKSDKRDAWSFLKGEMSDVKVISKKYKIPDILKNKDYIDDQIYRANFKEWIEGIWKEKDQLIEELKF